MRSFTLLESLAAVALLALAAATVAVRLSPSVGSARAEDARSIVLDADARARLLAARGGGVALSIDAGRVTIRVGDDDSPVVSRMLPDGVVVSLLTPMSRERLQELRVDRLGQSSDYLLAIEVAGARSESLVAGLTGYASAEEVSEP